eukprot:4277330-Pyramimonas_sp.AAC.1
MALQQLVPHDLQLLLRDLALRELPGELVHPRSSLGLVDALERELELLLPVDLEDYAALDALL